MADMIKITGLWKKDGRDGAYFEGGFGYGARVMIFRNKFKKGEKDPDLILYVAKSEPREKPAADSAGGAPDDFPSF